MMMMVLTYDSADDGDYNDDYDYDYGYDFFKRKTFVKIIYCMLLSASFCKSNCVNKKVDFGTLKTVI